MHIGVRFLPLPIFRVRQCQSLEMQDGQQVQTLTLLCFLYNRLDESAAI